MSLKASGKIPTGKNIVPFGQPMTKPERKNKGIDRKQREYILVYIPYLRKNFMSTSRECGKSRFIIEKQLVRRLNFLVK